MRLQAVLLCSLAYIAVLFLIAWWVDWRAGRGQSLVRNPYIYSLSLAVYCTAWTFYGSVGRASTTGMSFLAIYLGPSLLAPLWFLLLRKIILISKNLRITSIADFISSRYGKSTILATMVTIVAVLGIIPYISIQLKAVTFGINVLTGDHYAFFQAGLPWYFDAALWVTVAMGVFTILFGTRKLDPNERHEGLVAAIAFESLVKLITFFVIGYFVTYRMYGGMENLFSNAFNSENTRQLFSFQDSGGNAMSWNMLILLSALAILFLPRQFHIQVVENTHPRHLLTAMWMFPFYLLLINIFVFPIALAGKMHFGPEVNPDTFVLNLPLAMGSDTLALLAFIGGFSAATSMVIVESTALSIMISNHLIVPLLIRFQQAGARVSKTPHNLLRIRWVSILVVLTMAYWYLQTLGSRRDLVSVGLISFTAVAQFAPAALVGLFWKKATHQGAITGLLVGFVFWAYTLPLPAIADAGYIPNAFIKAGLFGLDFLRPTALFGLEGLDPISHAAFWSLLLNSLFFAVVSVNTKPSTRTAAQAEIFIHIDRHNVRQDYDFVKREAKTSDIRQILTRFMGEYRTQKIFDEFEQSADTPLAGGRLATNEFILFAETYLSGAIGAASARLVMDTVTKEEPITLEEMMQALEQTQEAIRYSRALETKSAELETTTRQLILANEQLKHLDRLKADFITTVTHELRTPVTSIKALSKIILDYRSELSDDKMQEYLQILVRESERISRLITQVLDLEKIQSDGEIAPVSFEKLDFCEIVQVTLQGMRQLFEEKDVECVIHQKKSPVHVDGNRDRLVQVVVNLLSNALKFASGNGEGRVDVEVKALKNRAVLRVRDNGIGISKKQQAFIFEKFTQVNNPEMGKPHGSGLGLYITKTIVEQHGGTIRVESESGQGATFEIDLPLKL